MENQQVIRERCSCGAEIETDSDQDYEIVVEWREQHPCRPPMDDRPMGGTAQVEQAPDLTLPELHVGFRPDPGYETKRLRTPRC